MGQIAKTYQDELKSLKKMVEDGHRYFESNRKKFNEMRRFVLDSNLTTDDVNTLKNLGRPVLEFNVLEAYISRLLGEFSKQEPALTVQANPSDNPPDADMVDAIEGHLRSIFEDFKDDEYEVYRDQLTGGFSAMKLNYDYENEYSFDHKIMLQRVYDPLLVGFDPSARKKHKGDGNYCYEFFPKTKEELEEMDYEIDWSSISQTSVSGGDGLKWVYKVGEQKIFLICDLYKKKRKKKTIYRLSDNRTVTKEQYQTILDYYEKNMIKQPPSIVQKRKSIETIICRYRFIDTQVLEYTETAYPILPIVFVDGNSLMLRSDSDETEIEQVVKPYVQNAIGTQRLKNMTGVQLANHIQTMVENKMKLSLQSIPSQYLSAYEKPQYVGNYIYNQYDKEGRPLNPPQEVVKTPLPPEVMNTFMGCDQVIQSTLGSYDASLGINNNQLSGIAIVEGATQSNAAAMPYIVGFLQALSHVAKGILDLIPKLYVLPRSIPIITPENKHAFVLINSDKVPADGKNYKNTKPMKISYNPQDLNLIVKPGLNFEHQQQRALQTVESLVSVLPSFAALVNGKGLPILLENIQIRGADRWRELAEEQVEMQQKMQQMQQAGQLPQYNPALQEIALKQQKQVLDNQKAQAEIQLKQQEIQAEHFKVAANLVQGHQDRELEKEKLATERAVHHANISLKAHDQLHQHESDAIGHAKDIAGMASDIAQNQQAQEMASQNQTDQQ